MASDQKSKEWTSDNIDTFDLNLDKLNPRIDATSNSTQKSIRLMLLQSSNVIKLARELVETGAVMAGERIIVVEERGNYIVLEGNRRTCACQLLLEPKLIPKEFRGTFPVIHDQQLKNRISSLAADIAPDRDAAEPIITRRHTQPGIEQWNTMAKHRRIARLFDTGRSISDIAEKFSMSGTNVKKVLREHHLLDYVRNLPGWSQKELEELYSQDLKTNPFTRFFTMAGVRQTLGITFDKSENLASEMPEKLFESGMKRIAKQFLIPEKSTGKPPANTRDSAQEVLSRAFEGHKALSAYLPDKSGRAASAGNAKKKKSTASTAGNKKGKSKAGAKEDEFFESLVCPIQDNRLIRLSEEISTIDHKNYSTAATFLLRALVESTLRWCIDDAGLTRDFLRQANQNGNPGSDPGLAYMLKYSKTQNDKIFNINVRRNLDAWSHAKGWTDLVIHGNFANANKDLLEGASSVIRPFIEKVFDGSILKSMN